MEGAMTAIELGSVAVEPCRPLVAGSFNTVRLTYTAGHPVDDTGYVKVAFRYASDFGTPQFDDPAAANYCRVETTGDCRVEPRWDPKGNTRPWGKALLLKVMGGFLGRGEEITVIFGDVAGGSPGWRAPSFRQRLEFKTLVDPIATYRFKEFPVSPRLEIVPGEPVHAACVAPSLVAVGQAFKYWLRLEDQWGNACAQPAELTHPGFPEAGVQTIEAADPETALTAASNPIRVVVQAPPRQPLWADLHGQSEETIGSNSIDEYFTFARDYARVDIAAHQGNDFQVTDELWQTINRTTAAFNEPDAFVTFPGYEWSANTPLGGDRNVYFAAEGGRIRHSSADLLPGDPSAYDISPTAVELFRDLAEQDGPRAFAFAHVGGRYADMSMHDDQVEIAVEVHSAWGTFEWLVADALERGCRIGICANSDGHKGRPGASHPGASNFGSYGGLTCVLAERRDRESVLQALLARRFYATTGNRSWLEVELTTADGRTAAMGEQIDVGQGEARLRVHAIGTGPITDIEIRNGLDVVTTAQPYGPNDLGKRLRIVWRGAEVRGRARHSTWDGCLSVVGNEIIEVEPINCRNPERQPRLLGANRVEWESITTGGVSGLILTLAKDRGGILTLATAQHQPFDCAIGDLGVEPTTRDCGGLEKEISVQRLPECGRREFTVELPLPELRAGDNAIYVRVTQEDGHMAWSSPIYASR